MCTLPNDVLIPIVEEFAEDYKTLSTLLTVSRNIYALALPLFYQELDISRQGLSDDRDLHSVVQKLYYRIESNPGLQFTASLRFDLWCFFEPLPEVRTVLPHLPNLRRLCILGPDPIGSDVLQLIPSTAQLTHLMLGRAFYEESLLSFLELHPKLAFLCINHLRHDLDFDDPSQPHPTLPRSALPALRSAEIPDDILRLIAGRASLVDLAITDADTPSPPFSYDVAAAYPSVCSLSVQRISFSGTTSLVASLHNLRYMRVHVDPREMDDTWRAALSTTKLAYMRFQGMQIPRNSEEPVRRLFEAVQTLALVDVGAYGIEPIFTRYHRNASAEELVHIPYRRWKSWWESARDDIEDAVCRCGR